MKKRYLILAGMLVTAQVFAAAPALAEKTSETETVQEVTTEENKEVASEEEEIDPGFTLDEEAEAEETDDSKEDTEDEASEEAKSSRPEYDFRDYLKKLGEYNGLTAEVAPLEEVTDEMVQAEIDNRMKAITDELTEGTVQEGDVANIDYVGKKDDVAFEGGTAQGTDLEIGSHSFIDGFEDGLIGVKIGDTVDLNLTFPEGYPAEDLAGADVVFTVTVNSVRRVAEFSDEAASQLSDGTCKDMAAYQDFIKEELINANKDAQQNEAQSMFWSQVVESSEFETMPEDVIAYDMQKQMEYDQNILMLYYGTTLEDYCTSAGMTTEDYEEMVRKNMELSLQYEIAEQSILEAEGIALTDEDFSTFAQATAENYGYEVEDFLAMQEASSIWRSLYYEKASEILMTNNTFTEKAAESDSSNK